MRTKRGTRSTGIEQPRLPEVATLEQPAELLLDDVGEVSRSRVAGLRLGGQSAASLVVEQSIFQRAQLGDTTLKGSHWSDVRFEHCDLVNADWEKAALQRAEFVSSRLGGMRLAHARIEHVIFRGCQLDFAVFWSARLRNVRFEDCRLLEASFEGVDMEGVVFRSCDLSRASMTGARLAGTDLRGCTISDMTIGLAELRGAILEPQQTLDLARLLEITIRPLDADEEGSQ